MSFGDDNAVIVLLYEYIYEKENVFAVCTMAVLYVCF